MRRSRMKRSGSPLKAKVGTYSSRSYGQYCALARSLDLIGQRWSLLIVRELLIEPRRFSDLKTALPGIASNLLAARLRELTSQGVAARVEVRRPVPGVVYELTELGHQLGSVVATLIRWGAPLMQRGRGVDTFDPRWLLVAFRAMLPHTLTGFGDFAFEIRVDDLRFVIRVLNDQVSVEQVEQGEGTELAVVISGEWALALVAGRASLKALVLDGHTKVIHGTGSVGRVSRFFKSAAEQIASS